MALLRPTLLNLPSFDANNDETFVFDISPVSDQVAANELIIRKQSNNEVVYDNKQVTFKYEHIVPSGTLKNGEYYNAVIITYDIQDNQSPTSLPIQFRCYTTPTIELINFPATRIVNASSFNFEFKYTQKEGERLYSYIANLYDISNELISSSGDIFVQDGRPPYQDSYMFTGLQDDSIYYVEINAKTINDAVVSTGKILFNVDYILPGLFTLLKLRNNCNGGYITVSSNIVLIDGVYKPDPPIFIDNKEIDLRGAGSFIEWPDGYSINGDFLARAWFRDPNDWTEIIAFSNTKGESIRIDFMKGYEDSSANDMKAYVQMKVTSIEGMEYYIYSNYITPLAENQYYNLQMKRSDGLYEIVLIDIGKEGA